MSRGSRAFTLVELLVALAIFAVLSAFAYRSLTAMLDSREALQKESRKWRDTAVFVGRVERDLRAVLDRAATSTGGTPLAPVSSALDISSGQASGLALTRSGAALQENALAAPQRVAYIFREGRIDRLAWASVDAAPREDPQAVPVLSDARSLAFRFLPPALSASGQDWLTSWGLPGSSDRIPAAVEMTLELASGERIVRVIDLPRRG
ncbi:MAG: type II secretion system minor pseudopilin GspJ [Bacillota bacterium]